MVCLFSFLHNESVWLGTETRTTRESMQKAEKSYKKRDASEGDWKLHAICLRKKQSKGITCRLPVVQDSDKQIRFTAGVESWPCQPLLVDHSEKSGRFLATWNIVYWGGGEASVSDKMRPGCSEGNHCDCCPPAVQALPTPPPPAKLKTFFSSNYHRSCKI